MLMHQFTPLFIHSQASEQGPSKLLSQEKAFFCGNCCFLPAVQWTSAGGWCDGLYSTVVLSHCSKLDAFFPSYMCRSQDFLRTKTSESFTWFISARKVVSCCPCQFLGCEYSDPSLGRFIVFVENSLRSSGDFQESLTNARGWQGRRRNSPVLGGHGDQIA